MLQLGCFARGGTGPQSSPPSSPPSVDLFRQGSSVVLVVEDEVKLYQLALSVQTNDVAVVSACKCWSQECTKGTFYLAESSSQWCHRHGSAEATSKIWTLIVGSLLNHLDIQTPRRLAFVLGLSGFDFFWTVRGRDAGSCIFSIPGRLTRRQWTRFFTTALAHGAVLAPVLLSLWQAAVRQDVHIERQLFVKWSS